MSATATEIPRASEWSAAGAAARLGAAGLGLGALGLGGAALVIVRLLETWRVGGVAAAHRITVLGASLSYPAANAGAVAILALAALALASIASALRAAAHEARSSRRLRRGLERNCEGAVGGAGHRLWRVPAVATSLCEADLPAQQPQHRVVDPGHVQPAAPQ